MQNAEKWPNILPKWPKILQKSCAVQVLASILTIFLYYIHESLKFRLILKLKLKWKILRKGVKTMCLFTRHATLNLAYCNFNISIFLSESLFKA